MMQADGINGELEPWDWRYYAEKRRHALHDLDEAALKPYLSLDAMIAAAFDCAHRLFGLRVPSALRAALPPGRPRLGGDPQRPSPCRVHRRLLRARLQALGRMVLGHAQPA